jgi:glycosyltransferase involved in cell wall biosynthesis
MLPRRVLFLLASDWYFYWHRLGVAERIAARGYEVHVATPDGRFRALIEAAGLRFHPIQIDRQGLNPLRDVATIKDVVELYRELSPDLVHHVAVKPIIYGSIAAKITGVPVIVNAMPGLGYVFVSRQLTARLIRPGIAAAFRFLVNAPNTKVIVENHDDLKRWVAWGVMRPDRVVVSPGCGVDVETFRPGAEPPGLPLVILPARLLFYKGVAEFVQAARILKARGAQARFALVGEGDEGNPACVPSDLLRQWQKEGVVELFGWHDDMAQVLAQCHIVCLPSHGGEGVPRSLLEAAASGKPIVATNVSGCRDAVRDGENGFLVPPRQAGPLADAIERLVRDGDLRRLMGERGRERALKEFSVAIVAAQTLQVYDELFASTVTKKSRPFGSIKNDAPVGDSRR